MESLADADWQASVTDLSSLVRKARLVSTTQHSIDTDSEDSETDEEAVVSEETQFDFVFDISSSTEGLMELLPTILRTSLYQQKRNDIQRRSAAPVFPVSEPAHAFVDHVREKFKEADPKLVRRLGEANWQRHVRIREQPEKEAEANQETVHEISVVSKSLFKPISAFHDSGLGSSTPAQSGYIPSPASHTSFQSTVADQSKGSLRVPPTPREVELRRPFLCEICGDRLFNIRNRVEWRWVSYGLTYYLSLIVAECTYSEIYSLIFALGLSAWTSS